MNPASLGGRGILVTRPEERAAPLARLIAEAGGDPVLFPTLKILSINKEVLSKIDFDENNVIKLESPDVVIFISPTAVEQGFETVSKVLQARPATLLAAVGEATAKALQRRAGMPVLAPQGGSDSESLAGLPQLQANAIGGKCVLIVRGEGGRDWLRDTLQSRGARVEYLECYRRVRPDGDVAALLARWRCGGIAAVTVQSRQALDNLLAMLPQEVQDMARTTPLFASHERIAAHARARSLQQVFTTGTGDEAMVKGLQRFFATVTQ